MGRKRGPDATRFWDRVRQLCADASDVEIAELFGPGISHSTFGNWKNNNRYPPVNYVLNFASAKGMTIEEVITGRRPKDRRFTEPIENILDDLVLLTDNELSIIATMVHPLAKAHRTRASPPNASGE